MPKEGSGRWTILKAEREGRLAVFRVRTDQPRDAGSFPMNVLVKWSYEGDARGLPPPEVRASMDAFEEAVNELMWPPGPSYLVLVTTGGNLKEWEFYVRNYDDFMARFNAKLAGHRHFPIEVHFTEDPNWLLWHRVRDHAVAKPQAGAV
jgi:hypothetical protein